jgi:hypothetical protein
MAVTIDDIVESATSSVLRALQAREKGTPPATAEALVSAGFNVEFRIICGGPRFPPWEASSFGGGKTQQ